MWSRVDEATGVEREKELANTGELWGNMLAKGSKIFRYTGSRNSAISPIRYILSKREEELCPTCADWAKQDWRNHDQDDERWWEFGSLDDIQKRSYCSLCRLLANPEVNGIEDNPEALIRMQWSAGAFQVNRADIGTHIRYVLREGREYRHGKVITNRVIDVTQIRGWLGLCRENHPECQRPNYVQNESKEYLRNFRVIDVLEERIVTTLPASRYLTLSYVWGLVPTLRLQKDNMNELMSPGGLKRSQHLIPLTIRNAIDLCRALNERYLWADTLCLIQDDPADMAIGIRSMDRIYAQSFLNIIAASGLDAEAGLPGVHEDSRLVSQLVADIGNGTKLVLTRELFTYMSRSKYVTRGWTYQEQHLVKRSLVFINQQVYFQCQRCVWSEDTSFDTWPTWENLDRGDLMYLGAFEFEPSPLQSYSIHLMYYHKRQFTKQEDILNGIAGVMGELARRMKCKFFQGLPTSCFDAYLLFSTRTNDVPIDRSARRSCFPSWSWAGWSVGVWFYMEEDIELINQWLDSCTWISYYITFPERSTNTREDNQDQGSSHILEFQGRQREELWSSEEIMRYQELGLEYVGLRRRAAFWVDGLGNERLLTEPRPCSQNIDLGGRNYPLLHFWTMTALYSIKLDSNWSYRAGSILDKNQRSCGRISLDTMVPTTDSDLIVPYKFIVISEAKSQYGFGIPYYEPGNNQDGYSRWRYRQTHETNYKCDYFWVVLVVGDAGGVKERAGIGQIRQSSLGMSYSPGPQWEEVILG